MNDARHAGGLSQLKISIEDKTYPGANDQPETAVRGFELAIAKDSFTALIGPSGCGKTTIMRILAGVDKSFTGEVLWAEEEPRIGFVFQEPRLLPWRTIRQNIMLTAHEDFTEQELMELTDELGIKDLLERFPTELSLGLARRASLARAFAFRPNVLLLDEPFVSLDEPTAERLRLLLIRTWTNHPVTAILVTHNIREAIQMADRLILLKPRPTSVLDEVPVNIPHGKRSAKDIDEVRTRLSQSHPEYFPATP